MATPAAAARDEEPWRRNKKKTKTTGGKESGGRWPQIRLKRDLQINHLKGNSLFTIPNFFTAAEAKAFIEAAESVGFVHQGSLGPAKGEAYRDNDRISVNDPVLAECIWESGLKIVFDDIKVQEKVAVGLNPNIRFYRYKVGQHFGRHVDESVNLGEGRKTQYTLLIYLSGGEGSKVKKSVGGNQESFLQSLVGGETVFYDQRQGVVAEVRSWFVYFSLKHFSYLIEMSKNVVSGNLNAGDPGCDIMDQK
ncbi:hypothetical protein COCNU_scaffold005961G000070 [Cocos nucifera]|nr:hypothetical protein [Cocos nucifera]